MVTRSSKKKNFSKTTRKRIIQAHAGMESKYNNEVRLRKETEEALAREKEQVEKLKLQMVNLKIKHEDMCIKAEEFESKHNNEVKLRKETEEALAREKEEVKKVKLQLVNLKIKHEDMCIKAEKFESKYNIELIFTKSLLKEQLELKILKGLVESCNKKAKIRCEKRGTMLSDAIREEKDNAINLVHEIMCVKGFKSKDKSEPILTKALLKEKQEHADAMRKERDNAIKLVNETTTRKQEIMKDPQLTSNGYTYEAEAIKRWLNNGHDTSPMTNLKLSHIVTSILSLTELSGQLFRSWFDSSCFLNRFSLS
ncbi:unnamed protein product [Arabis nemorensis]|uniref:U-box domain-containing protein n=1 Tax=Arabis nemorensis TaxID=586526 RepID=A0A565BGY1_9BRAS|nr:unnamed protein product [Arabis nemorensis]